MGNTKSVETYKPINSPIFLGAVSDLRFIIKNQFVNHSFEDLLSVRFDVTLDTEDQIVQLAQGLVLNFLLERHCVNVTKDGKH